MSVVLSEQLPLLASAPNGIQKLRDLILELAMRGKLVPQDPKDEPASELLKRVAKERERLEAEGTCRKSSLMPPVSNDERVFDAPNGWEWVRLATIGNIFNGNSINSNEKEAKYRRKDGLPYIATKDVGYGLTPLDYENGVRIPDSEPSFKMAHAGAVFICAEGGSAGKKCGITDRNVYFGNKLFANEVFGGIPPRVILYLYLSPLFRDQFVAAMTGIIGGVSTAKFAEIPIPLPPLAEQHRIVAKVDELMALCDRLEAGVGAGDTAHAKLVETLLGTLTQSTDALELAANWERIAEHFDTLFTTESSLDALKQTILQLAVMGKLVPQDFNDEPTSELLKRIAKERARLEEEGTCKKSKAMPPVGEDEQPYSLPDGWRWVRLPDVCHVITDGEHITPNYVESGVPMLSAKHLGADALLFDDLKFVSPSVANKCWSRCHPEERDILVVSRGGGVGRTIISGSRGYCLMGSVLLFKPATAMNERYLRSYLNSHEGNEKLRTTSGASAQQAIYIAHLKRDYVIPLPPLAEQHRIVAKVDELMALCDRLRAALAESRTRQARLSATLIESALQAA